jgi:hypothetical protein
MLHPSQRGKTAQRVDLSPANLAKLEECGQLPATVAQAMTAEEAAMFVLSLPPCPTELDPNGAVRGYVLLAPEGAWPRFTTCKPVQDINGDGLIRAGATGHLTCLWHHPRVGVMHRVLFRGTNLGEFRFADMAADCIGSIEGVEGITPHLTGWQVARG